MKKKINYRKVMLVGGMVVFVLGIVFYMISQMNYIRNYNDDITVYNTTYKSTDKEYHFDLKSFEVNGVRYVSLNDMYNMMVIMDKDARVYIDESKDMMRCQIHKNIIDIYYAKDKIVYNNNCVEIDNKYNNIYVSHKNIYVSVFLTEKIVLNNEKKINFENKNAIIEKN